MLLPHSFLDRCDFLVGQPVEVVDNLVDERVDSLDFRPQFDR
jgi:hypothetical protein